MSATTETDYENLRHYLLGRLSEEEERAVEARLLADPELFELAEAAEAEILDERFRGELAAADCQGLLDRLSASPAGRRRIALAQGFAALVSDTARPARQEPAKVLPFRLREFVARPAVRAALAAALIGAAVAAWQLSPGTPTSPALKPAPATARIEQTAQFKQTVRIAPFPRAEVPPQVLELSLITFRGGEERLPELPIPAAGTRVELRLALSPAETFTAYEVSLLREGKAIGRPRRLAAPRPPGTPLAVLLPAGALAVGTYEVEVRGVAPNGSTEPLGTPSFSVIH